MWVYIRRFWGAESKFEARLSKEVSEIIKLEHIWGVHRFLEILRCYYFIKKVTDFIIL